MKILPKLAPSVQRRILQLTPAKLLDRWSRNRPAFVIKLLCHCLNEKNPIIEERFLAPRLINPVGVAKKMSQLSVLSILNLLRQDGSLWQFYSPNPEGGRIFNLGVLPYILLELIFDLGGPEGRKKVKEVILKCRTTLGGKKQADILKKFKADNVIDLFEMMPGGEVAMILKSGLGFDDDDLMTGAYWLNLWDYRMKDEKRPLKSLEFLGKLPAERAFKVEKFIKQLERRRPLVPDFPDVRPPLPDFSGADQ